MAQTFSIKEIIEMGINIEVNGRDFYNTLANAINLKNIKELFLFLAKEEEKHIISFKNILDITTKDESNDEFNDEYYAYLNALSKDSVFTKKNKGIETAKKIETPLDAINMAIGFEKDSIIFYEGMRKVVSKNSQSILDILIAQEHKHIIKLIESK